MQRASVRLCGFLGTVAGKKNRYAINIRKKVEKENSRSDKAGAVTYERKVAYTIVSIADLLHVRWYVCTIVSMQILYNSFTCRSLTYRRVCLQFHLQIFYIYLR